MNIDSSASSSTNNDNIHDPSDVFLESFTGIIKTKDVDRIIESQRSMLARFEKTNEMLMTFNQLSHLRYQSSMNDYLKHNQVLFTLKRDLDFVFKKIRHLKSIIEKKYPDAFRNQITRTLSEEDENVSVEDS
ncbi:unnamed protein product [Dimorphilus gyrociliatus]|uniref:KxDL domain-containing protein n=1 Tax=Dimorphilus gyrociliatus TaxID=2664684 RepID=A0A7I8VC00_9ANNE|nr:unnamed protein product [Dimorphilus gyrociliatus]